MSTLNDRLKEEAAEYLVRVIIDSIEINKYFDTLVEAKEHYDNYKNRSGKLEKIRLLRRYDTGRAVIIEQTTFMPWSSE